MLDLSLSSGSQTRTDDLWVMSPTSCHCSIPQFASAKVVLFLDLARALAEKLCFFNIFLMGDGDIVSAFLAAVLGWLCAFRGCVCGVRLGCLAKQNG